MAREIRVQPTPEKSRENFKGALNDLSDYVFWNGLLWETWDLEGLSCMYNISPSGELFRINTNGCSDYEMIGEDDPRYDKRYPWRNWKIISNGNNGKVEVFLHTGWVDLMPRWLEDRPNTKRFHFVEGISQG